LKQIFSLLFLASNLLLFSHNERDSIIHILENTKDDSTYIYTGLQIANAIFYEDLDLATDISKLVEIRAIQSKRKKWIAEAKIMLGGAYGQQAKYDLSAKCLLEGKEIATQIKHPGLMSKSLSYLIVMHGIRNELDKSMQYLKEKIELDSLYNRQNNLAKDYEQLGILYLLTNQFEISKRYFRLSISLAKEHNPIILVHVYNNLSEVFSKTNDLDSAEYFINKSLSEALAVANKQSISHSYLNLADVAFKKKEYNKSLIWLKKAEETEFHKNDKTFELSINELYSKIYEKLNQTSLAFDYYKKYAVLKDSLEKGETSREIAELEKKYEISKKDKEIANQKIELERNEEAAKRKNIILWFGCALLIVAAVFSVVLFNRMKLIRNQRDTIQNQKLAVDEKNKEIVDSINYAKRIQEAILKEQERSIEYLPEHFVFFKPKDIVSGDFYWSSFKNDYWYFAVMDCTGHGVPGALMSMLGMSLLNDIISLNDALTPAEILDELRKRVMRELGLKGEKNEPRDGMDGSICRYNVSTKELMWAGANNPIYIIQEKELKEIKPNKEFIGYSSTLTPFTNHIINIKEATSIYLFSDGFADQFGGQKGKKFKYSQFKELLLNNHHLELSKQKEIIERSFVEWKGNLDQLDDICIIGTKLS